MSLCNSDTWVTFLDQKDVKTWVSKDLSTSILKVKSVLTIKVPQKQVYSFAKDINNVAHFWTPEFYRDYELFFGNYIIFTMCCNKCL